MGTARGGEHVPFEFAAFEGGGVMTQPRRSSIHFGIVFVPVVLALAASSARGQLDFGPEQLVQAGGSAIDVPGYSVPAYVDWDGDVLMDLVVGQGPDASVGKVRVYLNVGSPLDPQFSTFFYAQSEGADLTVPGSG